MNIRIGSLFSGVGGLELGLVAALGRVGVRSRIEWQAEKDPYARAVLAKHWPAVHRFEDVHDVDANAPPVDLLCGGFPCQDLSIAGKRAGIDGARSGLWYEFARVIRVLRPRDVFVENVPELLAYLGQVLGPLAALGYDATWDVFSAAEVGAPHRRERLFLFAHLADASCDGLADTVEPLRVAECSNAARARNDGSAQPVADAYGSRELQPSVAGDIVGHRTGDSCEAMGHTESERRDAAGRDPRPDVGRVVDGSFSRLDARRRRARLRCLGNGVVPQQAELAFLTLASRHFQQTVRHPQ